MKTLVSIIIPTYKRNDLLKKALLSIVGNNFEAKEVIIVNDDPQTDLSAVVNEFLHKLNIKAFFNEQRKGPISARNLGARKAQGSLIAFIDDDMTISENWLEQGCRIFDENPKIIGVVGKTMLPKDDFPHPLKNYFMMEKEGNYPTCNVWIKKDIFLELGGYDIAFYDDKMRIFHQEDSDLVFRLKKKGEIIFNPQLIAYHPSSNFSLMNPIKKSQKAFFDPLLKKKHPSEYSYLTRKCFGSFCFNNARIRLRILSLLIFCGAIAALFYNKNIGIFFMILFVATILGNIVLVAGIKNIKKISLSDWFFSFIIYGYSIFVFFFYLLKGMIRFRKFFL